MAITDPTNARLRDFDIPVIMPRIVFQELTYPAPPDEPHTEQPPVTTETCVTPEAPVTPPAASVGLTPPVVKLGLPAKGQRRTANLRRTGLAFNVASDKPISDAEVRLVQQLSGGRKRPLGVKLMIEPGKRTVKVVVEPSAFAKRKLALPAKSRSVRAVAIVTALDGSVGQISADFTLSG